jgi:hypothetical protein
MAYPSKIDRMPASIRELIGKLRGDGRTIDEILAKLQELDARVSRSALGRHVQKLDAIGEQIRRSRWIGEALIERLGDAPESRQARVNVELMHGLIMDLLAGEGGEPVELTPQNAMLLARALNDLARAHKSDAERELKLRQELREKVQKRIDQAERDLADPRSHGAPLEPAAVLKRIREEVYGILGPSA